jgi:hypothetical protein
MPTSPRTLLSIPLLTRIDAFAELLVVVVMVVGAAP